MKLRYTAYKKYLFYLNNFATQKKLKNIFDNNLEYRTGKTELRSYPYKITFDPGNICNLRCPGCHTGIKHPEMIHPSMMNLTNFKLMFEKVKDHVMNIALYNWGEPFLNKHIFDIISYSNEQKVGTTIHSNFNHYNENMANEVIKSKLTHIYLSIDGASQEIYSKYRVRGKIEQVIHNLEMLVEKKKKANSKLPFITWKYLKFPFNEMEIESARKIAEKIGVDNFEVFNAVTKLTDIYDEADKYKNNPQMFKSLKDNCKSLWSSIYIEPDGTVFPCSLSFREKESFGNLINSNFMTLWNNEKYISARQLFSKIPSLENVPLPCKGCKYYLKCCMGI